MNRSVILLTPTTENIMKLVRAQLKIMIATEEYNAVCKSGDWALIKAAHDKLRAAKREYQCTKLGLR